MYDRNRHAASALAVFGKDRVLFPTQEIRAPEGLRALIEVPEGLERANLQAYGWRGAARTQAGQNRIDWKAGYRLGASGAGDADYPTRRGANRGCWC